MTEPNLTQWADAGLSPSPEAMWDHLLIGLLQEGVPIPPDYPERLEQAGIRFPGDWFGLIELQVAAVDAYSYMTGLGHASYSEAQLVVNICELFRKKFETNADLFVFKVQSEIMCIVCGDEREKTAGRMENAARQMAELERQVAGIRLFAAVSDVGRGYESLGRAKRQVQALFEYRMFHLELSPVLSWQVLSLPPVYPVPRPDIQREQEILSLFRSGRFRQAAEKFGALFEGEYLALANPLILLKHKCMQYLDSLVAASREMSGDELTEELSRLAPERRLMDAATYFEVRAQMEHIFGNLNDAVLSAQKKRSAEWVNEVKNYIRGHYSDPDLNVNRVAEVFGKNPAYISRSFLRQTGQSILDYIHRYRIQEAKILIGRGETLAVTAEAVGYSNVLTMSRAFKKYEGTTPGKLKT